MNLNNFFQKDRATIREEQINSAKRTMHEAGSLFDETVIKLTDAQREIEEAQEQCEDEIRYHREQIQVEEEMSNDLSKRKESVQKVIQNVKELFTFEGID